MQTPATDAPATVPASPPPASALIAAGVCLQRGGRSVLRDVSLCVAAGRVHVVLGPNGAGKSSLLAVLAGSLAPDSGTVQLNGRALAQIPLRERARQRAVLFQQETLQFAFTAAEVVALGLHAAGTLPAATEREQVRRALEEAGATALAPRNYLQLSGGERARVQLARSLAQLHAPTPTPTPRYWLLDEPAAHLDISYQCLLAERLRAVAAEGHGVLAVLHDPRLALQVADDVSLLAQGQILAQGAARKVLSPAHLQRAYGNAVVDWLRWSSIAMPS